MKKIICLLSLLLLLSCNNEDNVAPVILSVSGPMKLATQAQVDAFVNANFGSVNGSLTIGTETGESDITDISGLKNLTDVSEDLIIINNHRLPNLEGLHNLKHVGEYLYISGNLITDLNGLRSLEASTEIYESLLSIGIVNNPLLKDFSGLEKIITLNALNIEENRDLKNLTGLNNLKTIYNLNIYHCPINSLDGLENINFAQDIGLIGNSNLTSLKALKNITSPVSTLGISDCNAINSLEGLENMQIDYLGITKNPNLRSLHFLENLSLIKKLEITECNLLSSLDGLNGLIHVDYLKIEGNNGLTSLSGLQNLTSTNEFYINNNNNLTSIEHLYSLTHIYNDDPTTNKLYISGNQSLVSLHGLENINPGSYYIIYIYDNPSLQDLCAIRNLTLMPPYILRSIYLLYNGNPVTREDIASGNCS